MKQPRAGSLRTAWRHRSFRYLLASYTVSGAGDYLSTVALVAYVFERTGSPGWVAATAVARIVPYALFGTIGGLIAGRYDRRKLMIGIDLAEAGVMAALATTAALDGPVAVVLLLAFVTNAASTPYRAAVAALTPDLVGEDDLAAANASEAVVNQVAMFVGPALGAALYAATSAPVAFTVNGATFVASAVLVARATLRLGAPADAAEAADGPGVADADAATTPADGSEEGASWTADLRQGVHAATRTPGVPIILGLLMAVMFAYGFEMVAHPLVAVDRLGIGAEGVGYLMGAIGIGGIAIAPWSGRFAASSRPGTLLAISGVLQGAPLVLLALVSTPVVAYALLLAEGVGVILLEVVAITTMQRLVKGDDTARVFGIMDSGMGVATLVGAVVAPVVANRLGLSWALLIGGAPLVVLSLVGWGRMRSVADAARAETAALDPVVDRLAALGLFDAVGRGPLEKVAAALTEVSVPAGTAVVREGDPSDDLYVVLDGTLSVAATTATEPIPDLGADDWFGEIGLLRGTARTATVTASTPVTLWRIPGSAFADAVDDVGPTGRLHGTMALRLARTPSFSGGTAS